MSGAIPDSGRQARQLLLAALLGTTALLGFAAWQPAAAQTVAAIERSVSFSIPAQPLGSAIVAFSRAADIDIVADGSIPSSLRAGAVSGTATVQQGLNQLLAGTGYGYRITGARSVTLINPNAERVVYDGSITLETIDVTAMFGPFGEEQGVVAQDAVTAAKVALPIVETPYSVSVINREQIEQRNPQTTKEILAYSPGVLVGSNADRRIDISEQSIRGFGAAILLDGSRIHQAFNYASSISLDPYLLERAEVLGGPAGVLYGQAAPGGAIGFLSKRPTEEQFGEVVLTTGNYGRLQAAFDVGGPVGESGTLLYRLTAMGLHTGTQVDHVYDERIAIAPAITWKPTDSTKLTVMASYQNDPAKSAQSSLPFVGTFVPTSAGVTIPRNFFWGEPDYNYFHREQFTTGWDFEHKFNETFTIRQNGKYIFVDGSYRDIYPNQFQADGITLNRTVYGTDEQFWSFGVDTQVEAKFDTGPINQTLLVGIDNTRNEKNLFGSIWGADPINVLNPVYGNYSVAIPYAPYYVDRGLNQDAIYAQDLIQYGNLNVLVGVRQDWATSWTQHRVTGVRTEQESEALTWRLGASYAFDNGIVPYVSYSTSFEPTAGNYAPERGGAPFEPTTGQQFEVGVKYQPEWLNGHIQVSAFDIAQQNVLTSDPIYAWQSIQTGEVRSRGIEASATLNVTDSLDIVASYTYLDLELSKSNDVGAIIGNVPWYRPQHVASLWANYAFNDGPLAGLKLGGGVRFVGEGYTDNSEQTTLPGYTLVDAAVSYDFGAANPQLEGLSANINVTNLFDTTYFSSCGGSCWYGDGRTITASMKYKF